MHEYSLVTPASTYKRKQYMYEYALVIPGSTYKRKLYMYEYSLLLLALPTKENNACMNIHDYSWQYLQKKTIHV